jgi:hypothetical protein
MIIVNFASKEYKRGQIRLLNSLNGHSNLMFRNYHEIGSPTHQESPYQFKIHAIDKGFEKDDIVLWCDASLYRVGDLQVIERIIKADGYFMEEAGAWVGQWTNQRARDYFQLTEEEGKVPGGFNMFSAGLLGLNLKSELAMQFFYQWRQSAIAGCFKGEWSDHRHDMACGSIIASRLGMKYQTGGTHMAYIGPGYGAPKPGTVFYLQGVL